MIYAGETCTIWRDTVLPKDTFTEAEAKEIADIIDGQVYNPLKEAFGDWSKLDVDQDGKTAYVFYDMPYLGYFFRMELYPVDEGGNQMDMLNIGTKELKSKKELVQSTLTHELQHFINFAQTDKNKQSESWLDEVFAQSAIAVAGQANDKALPEIAKQANFMNQYSRTIPFIFESQ